MRLLEEDDRARAAGEYDQPTVWRLKCLERLHAEQQSERFGQGGAGRGQLEDAQKPRS